MMTNDHLPGFDRENADGVPRPLELRTVATETIDIHSLFSRDVTSTGSFDMRGVEATSLGKLLSALPMTALLVDESHTTIFCNSSREHGPNARDTMLGRSASLLFPRPEDAGQLRALIDNVLSHRKPAITEALVKIGDRTLWGRVHLRTLRMGVARCVLLLIEDLTLEKRQILRDQKHERDLRKAHGELEQRVKERTAELVATNELMRQEISERRRAESDLRLAGRIIESSNEAILVTDVRGTIVHVNQAFTKITGFASEEVVGQSSKTFRWGPCRNESNAQMWQALRETGEWSGEVWDRRKDGEAYPKLLAVSSVRNEDQEVTHYVGIFSDITRIKKTEKRLLRLAQYDTLTGLPNRFFFHHSLAKALESAKGGGTMVAVMQLDLDRFKTINDTLGHRFGDKVLVAVAERLIKCLDDTGTAARLGGDEFAVILPRVADRSAVEVYTSRILRALALPYVLDRREVFITASIGVGLYPEDGDQAALVLQSADTGLYFAKERGRGHVQFFSKDMNQVIQRRRRLEHMIRVALLREQFLLHYQPMIDLSTRHIVGVEALLRFRHPRSGVVSAGKLIPIAEETGLIVPVGEWVLRTATKQSRSWLRMGLPPFRMAVNVSGRQLKQQHFADQVLQVLEQTGLDPTFLELELTESVLMDDTQSTIETFEGLRKEGVQLSIDDFGTGYSSLSYLKDLPVDKLKIDRSFVRDIATSPYEQAIVKAVLTVAHSRKLTVIAEGVENRDQYSFLRSNRCDQIQGYYISPPVSADQLTQLLENGPILAPRRKKPQTGT